MWPVGPHVRVPRSLCRQPVFGPVSGHGRLCQPAHGGHHGRLAGWVLGARVWHTFASRRALCLEAMQTRRPVCSNGQCTMLSKSFGRTHCGARCRRRRRTPWRDWSAGGALIGSDCRNIGILQATSVPAPLSYTCIKTPSGRSTLDLERSTCINAHTHYPCL